MAIICVATMHISIPPSAILKIHEMEVDGSRWGKIQTKIYQRSKHQLAELSSSSSSSSTSDST